MIADSMHCNKSNEILQSFFIIVNIFKINSIVHLYLRIFFVYPKIL
jgi:hypothetical protein